MVADGIGVSLLTQAVKINNPDVVALRLTDEAQPVFKIGLAYRQSTVFGNDQQHILTMIRDALGLWDEGQPLKWFWHHRLYEVYDIQILIIL